ncbi:hypothetical protein L1987_52346 [Smallanthus sonchifolius]|uniref:Uncharacterized protein n=1 Tax=Smallanthus sonchifolius TaxID=185202 RepID=A0ACB9ETG9_9ASTR|nr:hypothetical protein L1987_52346 [Smallanthus sonchifolius]
MMEEKSTKILCIRIGSVHVIAVSDPKIALEFLKDTHGIFSSRPDSMSAYLTSGGYLNTALAPMGDHWKKIKKILSSEILSMAKHKWLLNKRNEEYDNILRYINNQCETNHGVTSGLVNVRTMVQQYSGNMARKVIFGSRYFGKGREDGGPGDEEIEHVDSLLTILDSNHAFCVTDYFQWLRWITDFDGHEKIIRNAILAARMYQDPLIDDRIQQWKDGVRRKQDDLLDVAPFNVTHMTTADSIVAGYFIPKGSHVIVSRPGLGRNPVVWDDPLTFNPDRHMNGDKEVGLTNNHLHMFTFSTGRRGCPGVMLGSTITIMLLARLVQGFTWELPPNKPQIDVEENLHGLAKAKPLFALAKPRLHPSLYTTS